MNQKPLINQEIASTAVFNERVEKIYDHLYANAKVRTPLAICQEVGKIIHSGMFIEEKEQQGPAFSFTKSEIREFSNSASPLIPVFASKVHKAFSRMNKVWKLYEKGEEIRLSDFDITFTCIQLQGVQLGSRQHDVFGDALEIFRSTWAKRAGGQFFTDQKVTHLAMALLQFDPLRGDSLLDPAAGTGGFLLAGLNRLRQLLEGNHGSGHIEDKLVTIARKTLAGVEVDEEICAAANATLAARLGDGRKQIVKCGDSLFHSIDGSSPLGLRENGHRCIATNPPFGTKITIKDQQILRRFDLSRISSSIGQLQLGVAKRTPRPPDILFLELCIRLLQPGVGRLAIVLPYQILSGPQTLFIREWVIKHAAILAVIDLPAETFQPHTGTKTSLVVLKKRIQPLNLVHDAAGVGVFMSMPKWIGHDRRGNPIYRRDETGKTTYAILSDIEQVKAAYERFIKGEDVKAAHESSFVIDSGEIANDPLLRINALYHQPSSIRQKVFGINKSSKNWRNVRLGNVVDRIFYPPRFKRNYVGQSENAVPFLGGANITELYFTTAKYLRRDDPNLEGLIVKKGWILITRSGTTGIVSTVPEAWDGVAMSEHVIRIVPSPDKLPPFYLEVYLRSVVGQDILARGVFGSVIDEITPEYIADIEVAVPRNGSTLKKIVRHLEEAQTARNKAIEEMNAGLVGIEKLLLSDSDRR